MAAAFAELLTPTPFRPTTFPNDEGYDELVVARDIPFHSLCQHHLLPFSGVAHVGYLPGDRILGLSKLARVVEHFARGLQVQERLTQQVADWLEDELAPKGVGVVLEAEHLCMSLRGVQGLGIAHGDLRAAGASCARTPLPRRAVRPHRGGPVTATPLGSPRRSSAATRPVGPASSRTRTTSGRTARPTLGEDVGEAGGRR